MESHHDKQVTEGRVSDNDLGSQEEKCYIKVIHNLEGKEQTVIGKLRIL